MPAISANTLVEEQAGDRNNKCLQEDQDYVPEFAEAVKTQEIGVIGEPVKTQFGYHIIQVIAREELPLTGSQLDQKKQTVFDEWLTSAREAAKTTIYDIWKERVPTEPVLQQQ